MGRKIRLSPHRNHNKFLAINNHQPLLNEAVTHAPSDLLRATSKPAVNVSRGQVNVGSANRRVLGKKRNKIRLLSRKVAKLAHRQVIRIQEGGFAFIPVLLSPALVLSALDDEQFPEIFSHVARRAGEDAPKANPGLRTQPARNGKTSRRNGFRTNQQGNLTR